MKENINDTKDTLTSTNSFIDQHPTLSVHQLSKRYSSQTGLFEFSADVHKGEFLAIIGENGAGKSTLFKMIVGLISPQTGEIFLDGLKVTHLPTWKRIRFGMGYLGQTSHLFPTLSLRENIQLAWHLSVQDQQDKDVDLWIEYFQLQSVQHNPVYTLSGGEKRKAEFARVCIQKPKLLILDEPFAALDLETIHLLICVLNQLKQEGLSMMITDHQIQHLSSLCDRSISIHQGLQQSDISSSF